MGEGAAAVAAALLAKTNPVLLFGALLLAAALCVRSSVRFRAERAAQGERYEAEAAQRRLDALARAERQEREQRIVDAARAEERAVARARRDPLLIAKRPAIDAARDKLHNLTRDARDADQDLYPYGSTTTASAADTLRARRVGDCNWFFARGGRAWEECALRDVRKARRQFARELRALRVSEAAVATITAAAAAGASGQPIQAPRPGRRLWISTAAAAAASATAAGASAVVTPVVGGGSGGDVLNAVVGAASAAATDWKALGVQTLDEPDSPPVPEPPKRVVEWIYFSQSDDEAEADTTTTTTGTADAPNLTAGAAAAAVAAPGAAADDAAVTPPRVTALPCGTKAHPATAADYADAKSDAAASPAARILGLAIRACDLLYASGAVDRRSGHDSYDKKYVLSDAQWAAVDAELVTEVLPQLLDALVVPHTPYTEAKQQDPFWRLPDDAADAKARAQMPACVAFANRERWALEPSAAADGGKLNKRYAKWLDRHSARVKLAEYALSPVPAQVLADAVRRTVRRTLHTLLRAKSVCVALVRAGAFDRILGALHAHLPPPITDGAPVRTADLQSNSASDWWYDLLQVIEPLIVVAPARAAPLFDGRRADAGVGATTAAASAGAAAEHAARTEANRPVAAAERRLDMLTVVREVLERVEPRSPWLLLRLPSLVVALANSSARMYWHVVVESRECVTDRMMAHALRAPAPLAALNTRLLSNRGGDGMLDLAFDDRDYDNAPRRRALAAVYHTISSAVLSAVTATSGGDADIRDAAGADEFIAAAEARVAVHKWLPPLVVAYLWPSVSSYVEAGRLLEFIHLSVAVRMLLPSLALDIARGVTYHVRWNAFAYDAVDHARNAHNKAGGDVARAGGAYDAAVAARLPGFDAPDMRAAELMVAYDEACWRAATEANAAPNPAVALLQRMTDPAPADNLDLDGHSACAHARVPLILLMLQRLTYDKPQRGGGQDEAMSCGVLATLVMPTSWIAVEYAQQTESDADADVDAVSNDDARVLALLQSQQQQPPAAAAGAGAAATVTSTAKADDSDDNAVPSVVRRAVDRITARRKAAAYLARDDQPLRFVQWFGTRYRPLLTRAWMSAVFKVTAGNTIGRGRVEQLQCVLDAFDRRHPQYVAAVAAAGAAAPVDIGAFGTLPAPTVAS